MRQITATVLIVLLVRIIAALIMPLSDPSESRYATIAQKMDSTNNWVTPIITYHGEEMPFLGKPPLLNWLCAGSIKTFGLSEIAVRIPSIIAGLLMCLIMKIVLGRYWNKKKTNSAIIVTLSSCLVLGMIGVGLYDTLLACFTFSALLTNFAFCKEESADKTKIWSILTFLFLGLAFLSKGPVAIVMFGLPVFIWTIMFDDWQKVRQHQWIIGPILFLLITAPWFVACEIKNPGFLKYFFINENFLRYTSHNYGDKYGSGHIYPYFSAILMFLVAITPWNIIAIYYIQKTGWKKLWHNIVNDNKWNTYWLVIFVSITLFWCLARQLLATYLITAVPAFAVWYAGRFYKFFNPAKINKKDSAVAIAISILTLMLVYWGTNYQSPRGLIHEIEKSQYNDSTLYFAKKTPYSALFYSHSGVWLHGHESFANSANKFKTLDNTLLICRNKYINDEDLKRESLSPRFQKGAWTAFKKSADDLK